MSETSIYVSRDIMNSFMAHVEQKTGKDSCWLWKGGIHKGKNHNNTPSFSYTENKIQKNQPARAFIYQRTTGEMGAAKGGSISYRPKCGNPLCVKPSHIQVVSMQEVMKELKKKNVAAAEAPITVKLETASVVNQVTKPAASLAAEAAINNVVADYKNKNPLQFLAAPIKEAIEKQKQKISITQSLVADLEKELALFESELKRVED